MDLWELLGLLGILALWVTLGFVSWFVALVVTRGGGVSWQTLPLVLLAGLVGGAIVPALGLKGWAGIWTSLACALLLSGAVVLLVGTRITAARQYA